MRRLLVIGVVKRPCSTIMRRWVLRIYKPGCGVVAWLEQDRRDLWVRMRGWWAQRRVVRG